jgi:cyanophycin synthetase
MKSFLSCFFKKHLILILIIYIYLNNNNQPIIRECIQFNAPFMKPFYDKNNITIDKKNSTLIKNGKKISFKDGLNIVGKKNISKDKHKTKIVLANNNIPTPIWYHWNNDIPFNNNIRLIVKTLTFPIVIKPNSLEQGNGVHTNVLNIQDAKNIINKLLVITNDIILENQIKGDAYRIFIFNNEIIDCYKIHKPSIVGNGINTVSSLLNKFNNLTNHKLLNSQIDYNLINEQGCNENTILPKNKKIIITNIANGSVGSVAEHVHIKNIHPDNIIMFKKLTKLVSLNACGIDYITYDLSIPYYIYGNVLETNSKPGIKSHFNSNPNSIDKFLKLIKF